MIPYLERNSILIPFPIVGSIPIHAFGILVATGIIVGMRLTKKRGRELGLVDEMVDSMITAILITGFIVAHLFDVVAYQTFGGHPTLWDILNPIAGFSSFGGFIGAVSALIIWCKVKGQDIMPYADSLGYGLASGWMFGRLGCFTAHDHPGNHTHFFLAVNYPEGPRHDLGFDEALWAAGMTLMFALLRRKRRPLGLYVSLLTLCYAPVRFGLDFLRVRDGLEADPRYYGLTPAQWCCIVVLFASLGVLRWTIVNARKEPPQPIAI
jgi:phosphatidylglycerol---prolipoprotein diacylglyceryl transferase